jgi:single-strand DNA-binding protein
MNLIIILGRLTRDAELKITNNGKSVLTYDIASDDGFGDHKRTEFFKCVTFGKQAEGLANYLVKGTALQVTGSLKTDKWEKDGVKRQSISILTRDINFTGSKKDNGNINNTSSGGNTKISDIEDLPESQIPF